MPLDVLENGEETAEGLVGEVQLPGVSLGGGAMVVGRRSRAGSGLWVRVDDDTVWLDAKDAKGFGCTSTIEWAPVLDADHACGTGCTSSVDLELWTPLDTEPACGVCETTSADLLIIPRLAGAKSVSMSTTSQVSLIRDDTLEVLRLMALLPKTKRVQAQIPDDVQHVLDLIAKMKKKAA